MDNWWNFVNTHETSEIIDAMSKEEILDLLFDPRKFDLTASPICQYDEDYVGRADILLSDLALVERLIHDGRLDVNSRYDDEKKYFPPYARNCTLLCYAVMWGNVPLIELLIREKANVNLGSKDGSGNNPVVFAIVEDTYNILWDDNFSWQILTALNGRDNLCFDIACDRCREGHLMLHIGFHDVFCRWERLVEFRGFDINTKISIPKTVSLDLWYGPHARNAIYAPRPDRRCVITDYNLFIFFWFVEDYDVMYMSELEYAGINLNQKATFSCQKLNIFGTYDLPQFTVMFMGLHMLNHVVLWKTMDFNTQDEYGRTLLWYAARNGHGIKCRYLIDNGANENIKCADQDGATTPFEVAKDEETKEYIQHAIIERRFDHIQALSTQEVTLPPEMVKKILQENGF
jgi:hypothetical protein